MAIITGDVGGTEAKFVAYGSLDDPKPLSTVRFKVQQHTQESPGDFEKDLGELRQVCNLMRARHGSIEGVGLAVAGKLNEARSALTTAGNLGHWQDKPVGEMLSAEIGAEVVLGGDGEAAALAELFYGLGSRELQGANFLEMIWGTGVGGCGVHRLGSQFIAIPTELGHLCLEPDGNECRCGQQGCLEAYVGGNGIRDHRGKGAEDLRGSEWDEIIDKMVLGLRSVLAVQPVKYLVFSGGLICKQGWLLEVIEGRLTHPMQGSPKLMLSAFGESAGTLGALSLLKLARQG